MSAADPFAPDFVHHFHGGGRIELWNDGEVVVWDAMDRDMDDYELKPQYIERLKRLVLEAGPMGRWHHFLREMVVEDVEFKGSRRKKKLVRDALPAINPHPAWLRKARRLIATARPSRRNPMARRRSRSRNPRRGSRRGKGGWIKRHGKWVKGALARGGRPARRARRHRSRGRGRRHGRSKYVRYGTRGRRGGRWTEARARRKARWYQGRHRRSMRNPGVGHFTDGTSVSIDGDSVTLYTSWGETYDYSEVDSRARAKLMLAKTSKQAKRILDGAGVLASINPRRKRGRGRSRRNCGY